MQDNQQTNIQEAELTTKESFQILYDTAPKPIQDFLREKRYESVSNELIHVYSLSTKQTDAINSELVLMLIGAQSPEEFSSSIKKIDGLDNNIVEKLMNDINRLVFLPIQKQIELDKKTQSVTKETQQKDNEKQTHTSSKIEQVTPNNEQNNKPKDTKVVYTKMPPPVTKLPNKDTLISKSPIVKEYSTDPYREPTI